MRQVFMVSSNRTGGLWLPLVHTEARGLGTEKVEWFVIGNADNNDLQQIFSVYNLSLARFEAADGTREN